MEITDETIDVLLGALADQLQALGSQIEIVVIGGSALTALGLVKRATRDVDLLAIESTSPADLTRFTSSSLPWLTKAGVVMRRIFGRSALLGMNSPPPRAGR